MPKNYTCRASDTFLEFMLEEVLWGGLGIDELFDMWIPLSVDVRGGGDSLLELEELALKGLVVMLDFVAFKMPFSCLGALETWTTGGVEWSAGMAMIFGPLLCTGQPLRPLPRFFEEFAKGPSPETMASRSASTAEAMESGRGLVLQVFLWLLEVSGGMALPKGSI